MVHLKNKILFLSSFWSKNWEKVEEDVKTKIISHFWQFKNQKICFGIEFYSLILETKHSHGL